MEHNTFQFDTQKSIKKNFLDRIHAIFATALFLTGFCSLGGIYFFINGISTRLWQEIGVATFADKSLFFASLLCIFVSLVKIAVDAKPFSNTLVLCIKIISIFYMVGSVIIPRLPEYKSSGFVILHSGDFTLIDGMLLLFGLLLYILSVLIREGFHMQKELEEIL